MIEAQRKNIAIAVVVLAVIGIAAFFMMREPVPVSVMERTAIDESAVSVERSAVQEPAFVPDEKKADDKEEAKDQKPSGKYTARCMNKDTSLMYGAVVNKGDPKKLKTVTLKNMNTGETVDFDVKAAACFFEPAP